MVTNQTEIEYTTPNALIIHALGCMLVFARVAHAYGLTKTSVVSMGRAVGILMTFFVMIILAAILIFKFLIG